MGKVSQIEWCTSTWNGWEGCEKVSPGCARCYAERQFNWLGKDFRNVRRTSDKTFYAPLRWKRPELIFTCSMSDFFIEEADEWRPAAWQVIKNTPQHFYQILTKRPERIHEHLPEDWGKWGYPNVITGASVENQKMADERIPLLMQSGQGHKFLSIEPLLGPISLEDLIYKDSSEWWHPKYNPTGAYHPIHWFIIGGESGYSKGKFKYRPCELAWMGQIISELREENSSGYLGLPVFVKQMGTHLSKELQMRWSNGKRDLHGHNFDAFPPSLQHRHFPPVIRRFLEDREAWIEANSKPKKLVI